MKKFKIFICLLLLLLLINHLLPAQEPQVPADSTGLTIHFLDVGQADCALLACDGNYMLIDGGNVEDGSLLVSYLQKQGVQELAAVVCSHAHEDHVGGLPSALAVFPTKAVYAPTRTYSSQCFDDFVYYADQQDITITIPSPGDTFSLGSARVTVLGPVKSYADTNNTSLVLRIDYGSTSFLFTGDMEADAERDLLDAGKNLKVDVLKVGHHGSNTSSCYPFLYTVDPDYAVISVGTGNSYGHPHEEPMSRLEDADVTIYRTDTMGAIVCRSDGKTVTFETEKGSVPTGTQPTQATQTQQFIGNANSKKLHIPGCKNLPSEKNQVLFDSYQQALESGYSPCSSCMG